MFKWIKIRKTELKLPVLDGFPPMELLRVALGVVLGILATELFTASSTPGGGPTAARTEMHAP